MKRLSTMLMLVVFPVFALIYPDKPTFQVKEAKVASAPLSQAEQEFLQNFEVEFAAKLGRAGCPGAAVAIVRGNQVIYLHGFGKRRYGSKDLVNTNTLFRIGSLSKGFTGLLASKMVANGYISWDDKVRKFIPDFDLKDHAQANRITIKHVLSHSTGLQRHAYTNLTEAGRSLHQILPEFSKLPVYGREGKFYAYQNTAFSMVEEILQKQTGVPFTQLLVAQIFQPAGMPFASATYQAIADSENVALPHVWTSKSRCVPIRLNKKYYNAVSAGGINASITDMSAWLKVLLGNRPDIIGSEDLDYIFQPVVQNYDRAPYYSWGGVNETHYGIGWRIINWPNKSLVYHSGSVNGYRSEIALDRENEIGICILFNSNSRYSNTVIPDFFREYEKFRKNQTNSETVSQGDGIRSSQNKENLISARVRS